MIKSGCIREIWLATALGFACCGCVETEDDLSFEWLEEEAPVVLGTASFDFECDFSDVDWAQISTGQSDVVEDTRVLPRSSRVYLFDIDTGYHAESDTLDLGGQIRVLFREVAEAEPKLAAGTRVGVGLAGALQFPASSDEPSDHNRHLQEECSRTQDPGAPGFIPLREFTLWTPDETTLCFGSRYGASGECFEEEEMVSQAEDRGIERLTY